jgi:diguanylate cyclase (GGDEF)-like protein
MKKWVAWFFLGSDKSVLLKTSKTIQVATVNIIVVLGALYTVTFFTQLRLSSQIPLLEAAVAYVCAFIFIVGFIILHTKNAMKRFKVVKTIIVVTVVFLYSMVYAVIPHGDKWAFLIPLMVIFVVKLKWGLILTSLYFVFMVAAEIAFELRTIEVFVRYAAIYWAQVALIAAYEVLRMHHNKILLEDKKQIELLSITDHLTKLYNRRYFSEILEREYARAVRQQQCLSFIMIDVDFFKKYNDTYGHLKGDELLISIADTLKKITQRSSDFVFRMGGEEFGVLLPDTDANGAYSVAEKIRMTIWEMSAAAVSVGYASALPKLGESSEALLKKADDNLYKAKNTGRNRVVG